MSGRSGTRAWLLVGVLTSVPFLVGLDSLMVALALPAIGRDLDLPPAWLAWVVNAYSLALGALLLLGGRLADLFGRRRVLLAGLGLLSLGALAAAVAPAAGALIAARAVQGLGAALAYPACTALVAGLTHEPWRGRAFSGAAVSGATGSILGAVLGGVVTGLLGWRAMFAVTVPLGLAVLAAARAVLPADRPAGAAGDLDVPGAVLGTGAVTAFVLGLGQVEQAGPAAAGVPVAVAVALLTAFVRAERRARRPLLRLGVLRSRRLVAASLGIAANAAVYSGAVFTGTLYLQGALGLPATTAGLAFLPVSGASVLAGVLGVGPALRRHGANRVAGAGLALGAAALALLAAAPAAGASYAAHVLPAFALIGLALPAASVALTRAAVTGAAPGELGVTVGVFQMTTHVGGAVAVATSAALVGAGHAPPFLTGAAYAAAGCVLVLVLLPSDRPLTRSAEPRRRSRSACRGGHER